MKTSKKTTILAAAISGLVLGSTLSLQGCKSGDSNAAAAPNEKHACQGLNSCKDKGGCKGTDNSCMNKNACKGKGGCATVKHDCAKKNECKMQGGCTSGDNKCAGKNSCTGKGGRGVPVNKDHKK